MNDDDAGAFMQIAASEWLECRNIIARKLEPVLAFAVSAERVADALLAELAHADYVTVKTATMDDMMKAEYDDG